LQKRKESKKKEGKEGKKKKGGKSLSRESFSLYLSRVTKAGRRKRGKGRGEKRKAPHSRRREKELLRPIPHSTQEAKRKE